MKIIWGDPRCKSHAWDFERFGEPTLRWGLCGIYVYETGFDAIASEVTCRTCLRLLAARELDNKLQPIAGHD